MALVEPQHIQAVLAFNPAVVLGCPDSDTAIFDSENFEYLLKPCHIENFLSEHGVGELPTVVGLHLLDFEGRCLYGVTQEDTRSIIVMFIVDLPVTLTGILIHQRVLVKLFPVLTHFRNILHIYLNPFSGKGSAIIDLRFFRTNKRSRRRSEVLPKKPLEAAGAAG